MAKMRRVVYEYVDKIKKVKGKVLYLNTLAREINVDRRTIEKYKNFLQKKTGKKIVKYTRKEVSVLGIKAKAKYKKEDEEEKLLKK